ncbi:MAG: hydroxyethylthiazole kinase [Deferribacteraceae bacterium]|jgi:hydroxyethylthiazole kinase|nr:hydroxyethylthiazole kinase [Deferribacteraceae bacterium]
MSDIIERVAWPNLTVAEDLKKLRAAVPLTHCITNIVATNFTANILLAIGASPAMVVAAEEAGDFASVAQGLLINVGTITRYDREAMLIAAESAHKAKTPWVLDPVAAGPLAYRTEIVYELIKFKPNVIRGNASEIIAVAGATGNAKGPDSTAGSDEALPYAKELALKTGSVVAVSGETDYITDGEKIAAVPGGHILMTKTTGTGCALGAVIAAFLAVAETDFQAAVNGSVTYAETGLRAAKEARGSGSFAVRFLDHLSLIGKEY